MAEPRANVIRQVSAWSGPSIAHFSEPITFRSSQGRVGQSIGQEQPGGQPPPESLVNRTEIGT